MRRLFVTDLDETLLVKGNLPRDAMPTLQHIIDSGVLLTVATARGLRAATLALEDAVPLIPLIVSDGAVISYANGREATIRDLSAETVDFIARLAKEFGAPCCELATDNGDEVVFAPPRGDEFTDWSIDETFFFKAHTIVRGDSLERACRTNRIGVVICGTDEKAKALEAVIARSTARIASIVIRSRDRPGFSWLKVSAPSATKSDAVLRLAERFGLTMDDVVYYGDGANDLQVMNLVGEAVAVANADSEVLAAADRVIGAASTGAVAKDILDQVGLHIPLS